MTDVFLFKMKFKRSILFITVIFFIFTQAFSQEVKNDSVISHSLFVFPYTSYQPETSWMGGLTGAYYFNSHNLSRISSVTTSAEYTLRNQFSFSITPKVYLQNDKWLIYANLNFRNYPDYFYGTGNKITDLKQAYTSKNFNFNAQTQLLIRKNLYIGGIIDYRNEKTITDPTFNAKKDYIYSRFGVAGWTPYSQFSLGLLFSFDNRDNQFYPYKGIFVKSMFGFAGQNWGSTYSMNTFSLDIRQFLPVIHSSVFAWQFYCKGVLSNNNIPFQLLPTPGGIDLLRGFQQGMFRDNWLVMLQTEYRLPLYKKLKAAIFCSAGDVVNSSIFQIEKLKIACGAGLRYQLNDARVHLRLDIAKNNYGNKPQLYLTASEAF